VTQQIELNALISETAELLRVSLGRKIALNFDLAPSLPRVPADGTQIRQVLMNLILNASEAIGSGGGAICVTTGLALSGSGLRPAIHGRSRQDAAALSAGAPGVPANRHVFMAVADTGCGMDERTHADIFAPCFA